MNLDEISVIRPHKLSDLPYIGNAWVQSNADTPLSKQLGGEYKHQHSKLVWAWLACSTVHVCCDKVDDDAILGFLVRHGKTLHYLHVRRDFRRLGIAHALLAVDDLTQQTIVTTHQICNMSYGKSGKPTFQGWRFDPYVFLAGAPK